MQFLSAPLALLLLVPLAAAQNCGPAAAGALCPDSECCSQYGWCGTTPDHCSSSCQPLFSGDDAPCPPAALPSSVPEIDVCGAQSGGVSCPGVGVSGWFYRCCSSAGHCGPKNTIQDPAAYCGLGCQAGYGRCDPTVPAPPNPPAPRGTSAAGGTCGPIVNRVCATGLCCSGSNFCGTGEDFCGAANWCQPSWGRCDSA